MKALLLVQLQIDFSPGGAVFMANSDRLTLIANQWMERVDRVVHILAWHRADDPRFAANHLWRRPWQKIQDQLLWPMHCVDHSFGALPMSGLYQGGIHLEIKKQGYSGFENTELAEWLREQGVQEVLIMGLPLEYGVLQTAEDAVRLGFSCTLLPEGCEALELEPEDKNAAYQKMRDLGIRFAP